MTENVNRRDLLTRGSALAMGLLVGGAAGLHAEELVVPEAQATAQKPAAGPAPAPVKVAVIGLGEQGRTILVSLSYVPGAVVSYVCDTYTPAHKRALELFPTAKAVTDYKAVLADKDVQGVYIATPSHLHKQIVLDALAAGKHVYCETPLASSIADAKAIAQAANAAGPKVIFHSGLQYRTNPQHKHVRSFIQTGAIATLAQAKAHWHKKNSWRRTAPTDERQDELNWRLSKETSGGLLGEVGIHQIDVASWFIKSLPKSVTGFGSTTAWQDGRDVPDTVQCLFEYDGGVHLTYDATLANSFDGFYELFQGTDAAVLLRGQRAWMFKEADAQALGWEVYAYKEVVGDDTGIALVADATKLLAEGKEPGKNRDIDPKKSPMYYACEAFVKAVRAGKPTDVGPAEGYAATVVALTANEAILTGRRIEFTSEMFSV